MIEKRKTVAEWQKLYSQELETRDRMQAR